MSRRASRDPGKRYVTALSKLERAESKMTRAFRAWTKARDELRRVNKLLDSMQLTLDAREPKP